MVATTQAVPNRNDGFGDPGCRPPNPAQWLPVLLRSYHFSIHFILSVDVSNFQFKFLAKVPEIQQSSLKSIAAPFSTKAFTITSFRRCRGLPGLVSPLKTDCGQRVYTSNDETSKLGIQPQHHKNPSYLLKALNTIVTNLLDNHHPSFLYCDKAL